MTHWSKEQGCAKKTLHTETHDVIVNKTHALKNFPLSIYPISIFYAFLTGLQMNLESALNALFQ